MDDCRRTEERMTPYVDEVLPPTERSDVERHLTRCPPCRQSAAEEQGARRVVRECADRLRQEPLPPGLRSRCEALAREHAAGSRASWRARLVPAVLIATAVFVAAIALFSLVTRESGTLLAAQLAADHVKCSRLFASGAGEADPHQVESDLEEKYGWDMHVPPSSAEEGLQLVGGRRCLYGEGTMPHVMYRAAGAVPVSLFRLDGDDRDAAELVSMGQVCRMWSRGGHTYVLVAPQSASGQMARLTRYMQREAR